MCNWLLLRTFTSNAVQKIINFRRKCSEKQNMRIYNKNAIIDRQFVEKIARNKQLNYGSQTAG